MISCQGHILDLGEGPTFIYNTLFTFITFFDLFQRLLFMNDIVIETNRYATRLDPLRMIRGGHGWKILTLRVLRLL